MSRIWSVMLACLAVACATAAPVDVRLVSRSGVQAGVSCSGERCGWVWPEITFRDGHGGTAMMEGSARASRFEPLHEPDVTCGGTSHPSGAGRLRHRFDDADEQVSMLRLDDASLVRLIPERAVRVADRCYDESGRWEGVDGPYSGRRGTYRLVLDRLQADLTLSGR